MTASLRHFEDCPMGALARLGPAVITAGDLAAFVALTGEAHPLHVDDGIVPGSLVQARGAGLAVAAEGPLAVRGLRRADWRFTAPLRAEQPWWLESRVLAADVIDDSVGLVRWRRDVLDEAGALLARGVLEAAVERRRP